jgi:hypothetical protein
MLARGWELPKHRHETTSRLYVRVLERLREACMLQRSVARCSQRQPILGRVTMHGVRLHP